MKTRLITLAVLLIPITAVLTSCNNKIQDSMPQYMRGGNSILSDGNNLVIAGYNSVKLKGYDAVLLKVNSLTGDTIWTKAFGGSYSDAFFNVQQSNKAEGYIATGFSNNANGGSPSMLIVKTDKNGKLQFSKTYAPGGFYTEGFGIVPNADSGYLVVGFIQKSGTTNRDILLERIDDDGTEIWTRTIGAQGIHTYDSVNEVAYAAIAAPGGGYFITGAMKGVANMEGSQIFLMKVSATGDSVWTKTFGTGFGYSLTLTKDGSIAVSGSILKGTDQNVFLLKTDLAGNLFTGWTAPIQYGGAGFEYGASMIETSDGGYAITGITESVTNGLQDIYFVRTNSMGATTYEKNFGGADNDQGYGLIQTSDNYFYITGLSNTEGSYIYLNKLNTGNGQETGWPKLIQY